MFHFISRGNEMARKTRKADQHRDRAGRAAACWREVLRRGDRLGWSSDAARQRVLEALAEAEQRATTHDRASTTANAGVVVPVLLSFEV
jgi:hypothetical protein